MKVQHPPVRRATPSRWKRRPPSPTALDVLLEAQGEAPDLAFRYGCRNELCGVCTVEVNGKPRLACRQRVRDGDTVAPLSTLPAVRDLVVRRDAVNRQLARRLPVLADSAQTSETVNDLNRCIECYACLDGCPMHEENDMSAEEYPRGNPFALLKIQRVRVHPSATDADRANALELAEELGLEVCDGCPGCRCGVGINLGKQVIGPLLDARRSSSAGR